MLCIKDKCQFYNEDPFKSSIGRCNVSLFNLDKPISKDKECACAIDKEVNRLHNRIKFLMNFTDIIENNDKYYKCNIINCDYNYNELCNSVRFGNRKMNDIECSSYECSTDEEIENESEI